MFLQAQKEDPFQVRELRGLEVSALLGPQLRHQLVNRLEVVDVLVAVDEKQVLGFRLREHVGELADAVVGVDR